MPSVDRRSQSARTNARVTASLVLAGFVAACTVGPNFQPPVVTAPGAYGAEPTDVPSVTVSSAVDARWWRSFNDPELSSLEERVASQNLDLKSAAERVLQGRAQSRVVASEGLPQINGQSTYSRQRVSPTGIISLEVPAPGAPLEYDLFQNGLSSSWDLDLFGRIRRGVEAADADTLASVENRRGIALAAISDLAQDYLQLRGAQARLAIIENNARLAEQNAQLVKNRFANGVATTLDMAQAQAQVSTVTATLPPLRIQVAQLINAIGLLLGEQPRALQQELLPPAAQPGIPPVVPVGLPGTLVRRRPDVRQAEASLHAATAQTGVAVASFYPDIKLTGNYDLEGLRFKDAFSLYSRAFQVGPTLSVPIFQGGRLRGTLRLRESEQRQAAINFQKTVLQAFQEVDDALTAYAEVQRQKLHLEEAVEQNGIALTAARQRYSAGAIDFLNVISTQTQLLQSQSNLANMNTQAATNLVTLYRALGGGWEITEQPARMPADLPGQRKLPGDFSNGSTMPREQQRTE